MECVGMGRVCVVVNALRYSMVINLILTYIHTYLGMPPPILRPTPLPGPMAADPRSRRGRGRRGRKEGSVAGGTGPVLHRWRFMILMFDWW